MTRAYNVVDADGHIASVNATGQRVFGYGEAEVIGRPLTFLLPQLGLMASVRLGQRWFTGLSLVFRH